MRETGSGYLMEKQAAGECLTIELDPRREITDATGAAVEAVLYNISVFASEHAHEA